MRSCADEVILRSGDVILLSDGVPTEDVQSLLKPRRFSHAIDDEVALAANRDEEEPTLHMMLRERCDMA